MLKLLIRIIAVAACLVVPLSSTAEYDGISNGLLAYVKERYGSSAEVRLLAWQKLIKTSKNKTELEKIKLVNDFINKITFVSDQQHWAKKDYWATPIEFLATNGGDCEDFSIAKYFTLKELGIPPDKLRITYVKALKLNQAHMVLSYYQHPSDVPLILDNLIQQIAPANERDDLKPVYSFNAEHLWLAKRGKSEKAGKSKDLNLWRNLTVRIAQELNQ